MNAVNFLRCYMDSRVNNYTAHGAPVALLHFGQMNTDIRVCKECLNAMLDTCDDADVEPSELRFLHEPWRGTCHQHAWQSELCHDWPHSFNFETGYWAQIPGAGRWFG